MDEYMMRKLGHLKPLNWLMKIATNLEEFRKSRKIVSDVEITNPATGERYVVKAMWDTGATYTCVSDRLAVDMGLVATGHQYYLTQPRSTTNVESFDITIRLDMYRGDKYTLRAGSFSQEAEFDVIIGLDMILNGQLKLGSKDGVFNFEFTDNKYLKDEEKSS